MKIKIQLLTFFIPTLLLQAKVPEKYKDLMEKTGIIEGQYQTIDKSSLGCDPLEIRFYFPKDQAPTIINGASPLFESIGKSKSYIDRDCKRTIKSVLEKHKITQEISVHCKKIGNYTFYTNSELKDGNLIITRKVTKDKKVTESSSCTYEYTKKNPSNQQND